MKKPLNLYKQFKPERYELESANGSLKIYGLKTGRPNKRITLHQRGLKITDAKIISNDKKGLTNHEVIRINHLPTRDQVRLHTAGPLYPGRYTVELSYRLPKDKVGEKIQPNRQSLPSIDEPEAWAQAKLDIK